MTKPPQKPEVPPKIVPVKMLPEDIAAFGYSLDNHSKMMAQFALGFTSLFGVLNSGAVVGLLAFAATDLGSRAIIDNLNDFKSVAYLFGMGFISASSLMIAIFFYSNHKYIHYRNILRGTADKNTTNEFKNLYAAGWALCTIMVICTFSGLSYTLELITKTTIHKKNDAKATLLMDFDHMSGKTLVITTTRTARNT